MPSAPGVYSTSTTVSSPPAVFSSSTGPTPGAYDFSSTTSGSNGFHSADDHDVVVALAGHRHRLPDVEDLGEILGLALVELLAVGIARRWGSANMTMPGSAPSTPASHEPSVLTTSPPSYSAVSSPEVPDVAVGVLRVPVVGVLDHLTGDRHGVVDHHGVDPHHRPALVEHGDLDLFASRRSTSPRRPSASPGGTAGTGCRCGRPSRRVERGSVVAAVSRVDHRLAAGRRGPVRLDRRVAGRCAPVVVAAGRAAPARPRTRRPPAAARPDAALASLTSQCPVSSCPVLLVVPAAGNVDRGS